MENRQKRTYLVYSRGLRIQDLSFGSLYMDPANPLEGEHKRFESQMELKDIDDWVGDVQLDEPCSLTFTASQEWSLNAGAVLLTGQVGQSSSGEVTISGTSGRRYQINKPEAFLNDVILKSPIASEWLKRQLSISRAAYLRRKLLFGTAKQPKIWMVTGIQYITGGDITNKKSRNVQLGISANVVVPEPTAAVISILTSGPTASVGGLVQRSSTHSAAYLHSDERIWAAQFTPLKVEFLPREHLEDVQELGRITLRRLQDLGGSGIRGNRQSMSDMSDGETAVVHGIEDEMVRKLDDDPASLLQEIEDVDWGLFDRYSEQLEVDDVDSHLDTSA